MGEYIHYDESRFKSTLNVAVTKTPIGLAGDSDSLSLHEEGDLGYQL
jgi:hypothetical protein